MLGGYLATRGRSAARCARPRSLPKEQGPHSQASPGEVRNAAIPPQIAPPCPQKMLLSAGSHHHLSPSRALHGACPRWATVTIQPPGGDLPGVTGGMPMSLGGPQNLITSLPTAHLPPWTPPPPSVPPVPVVYLP